MMVLTPGVRPPLQERSRNTLERILESGAVVLSEHGYEGVTIARVCEHAATSPGAVYTRFENKDALLRAIHDHALERLSGVVEALYSPSPEWDALSTPELIEMAVNVLIRHFRDEGPLVRAIVLRAAADPLMRTSGATYVKRMADAFVQRVLSREGDYTVAHPAGAVRDVFSMVFEAISWDVTFGADFRAAGALGDPPDRRLPALCRGILMPTEPG